VGVITPSQRAAYDRDGYLVLPGCFSRAEAAALVARAGELLRGMDLSAHRSIFTTREQVRTSDEYFLASGDRISYFFEDEAVAPDGSLRQPPERAINKIGHALHDLDPVFARFSRSPALAALAADLGFRDPLLLQSMYIFKQPHIGGEVTCHQDATFLWTDPITVVGLWFALEDATLENGCMWVLPGGQRHGLRRRFVRAPEGGTRFIVLDPAPFAEERMVPLEVEAGGLVVLHGLAPHRSGANRSPRSRQAYTLHLIEGWARYPADNWLQRAPEMPLRGFSPTGDRPEAVGPGWP
jgi:phytanoyl-CoA hydroxylase